jgi:hypothetical protein
VFGSQDQTKNTQTVQHMGTERAPLSMTRWAAFRSGAWRGAKVGFWTFETIVVLLCTIGVIMVPFIHEVSLKDITSVTLTLFTILKYVGGTIVFLGGFGVLYGAVPGALILGIAEAVRWRPVVGEPKSG